MFLRVSQAQGLTRHTLILSTLTSEDFTDRGYHWRTPETIKQGRHRFLDGSRQVTTHSSMMIIHFDFECERVHECVTASIRQQAEQLKKDLSTSDRVPFHCIHKKEIDDKSPPSTVSFIVSKEDFHSTCAHLFERGLVPVRRLLTDLGMFTKQYFSK